MENNELLNLFRVFLRKKRLYLTNSRMHILEAAAQHQFPFDAETLWMALKAKHIGLSTVYRTLSLLVEAGLVRRILGKSSHFEVIYQKATTEYLQCMHCGQWTSFPSVEITGEIATAAQQRGFTIASIQFTIQGECRSCKLAKIRSFTQLDDNIWK